MSILGVVFTALTLLVAADISPVADAAQRGDIDRVRSLLREGADVSASQGDGMTALHWAALKGNVELTELLLKAGATPKATTRNGSYTPLLVAAQNGHASVMEILLKAGARVRETTTTGITPLMLAAAAGRADAVGLLLKHGADVNARETSNEQTALMLAAALNHADVINVLAEHRAYVGATTKVRDLGGEEPPEATGSARAGQSLRDGVRQLLLEVTAKGRIIVGGLTALHYAAREGRLDAVRALLDSGADINQRSPADQSTPLLIAAMNGQFDAAMYLLERGADPNLANTAGTTPIYAALSIQWAPEPNYPKPSPRQQKATHLDLIKATLDRGANPNARVKERLWWTYYENEPATTGLTEAGATPFWRAAKSSDIDAMRLLVAGGADPAIANNQGVTPLSVAAGTGWTGNFDVNSSPAGWMPAVKYLVDELGANVNAVDMMGSSVLHGAAWRGDNEMILYLVAKGADVTAVNRLGLTVADMANGPVQRIQPFPETVKLLLKLGSPFNNQCVSC